MYGLSDVFSSRYIKYGKVQLHILMESGDGLGRTHHLAYLIYNTVHRFVDDPMLMIHRQV